MDGGMPPGRVFRFDPAAADVLMPMHLGLQPDGRIVSAGPTLRRLFAGLPLLGHCFHSLFHIRRPSGLEDMGRRMRFKANTPTKPGVSKGGLCLPFGTRTCLQGVVCYTCRRG